MQKKQKLIVKLRIRISPAELNGPKNEQEEQEEQEDHMISTTGQLGRGIRVRRVPKRLL